MSSKAAQSPTAGRTAPPVLHFVQGTAPPAPTGGEGGGGGGVSVEVDEYDDSESAYASGRSSTTTSLSSSVFDFVYANGRRYQSRSTDYFMPNDEPEQDRLDLYHHMFLMVQGGKLYTAPLSNPQRVLDVGTGTGIWVLDFADLHPEAEVIGTDISPIQPTWVPPNAKFEIDDMELEWAFPDNHFDYIHMRSLSGAFADWDAVLAQAFKKTAPGGYLEFQDYGCEVFLNDGTRLEGINDEHPISSWMHYTTTAAERAGRPLKIGRIITELMKKAGFEVHEQVIVWPMGTWPKEKTLKEIGKWGRLGMTESAYPYALHLLTREGWTPEQIRKMVEPATACLHKGKYYAQGWFVYGKKPEA